MNKILRKQLKELDVCIDKLGYKIGMNSGSVWFKRKSLDESLPSSYIKIYPILHKVDWQTYFLEFVVEPCKIPGGRSYIPLDAAEAICDYWKKAITALKSFNDLHITATVEEMQECINDIERRKRG